MPKRKLIIKVGRWRLDLHPHKGRFAVRSGGGASPWPWREISVPRMGSLILSRTRPRALRDRGAA